MFTVTKWIAAPVAAIGLMFAADAPSAEAQYPCYRGGGLSISIGSGYGHYRPSYGLYRSNFGYGNLGRYGSRYGGYGAWDYRPSSIYRHGSHWHVRPRHYDVYGGFRGHTHYHRH